MAVRDLIPWGRTRSSVPSTMQGGGELDPFVTLQREMNRVFDDMFRRFDSVEGSAGKLGCYSEAVKDYSRASVLLDQAAATEGNQGRGKARP
jgi:hypothetical protein